MSTTISEVKTPSKKRKSQEDLQKSHKKRRYAQNGEEVNGIEDRASEVEEAALKSAKKDKKKKSKPEPEDSHGQGSAPVLVANSDTEAKSSSQRKKKSKKHSQETSEDATDAIVPNSDIEAITASQKDKTKSKKKTRHEEMPGASEQTQTPIVIEDDVPREPVVIGDDDVNMEDAPSASLDLGHVVEIDHEQMRSSDLTAFHSIRASLYLPLPPHGSGHGLGSLLTLHVAPLLLSYFPPLDGVVLGYKDCLLSAKPLEGLNQPLMIPDPNDGSAIKDETESKLGDEFGATWTWLTATFLVFRPIAGEQLPGWTNARSEGFVGLVSYNYFQSAVAQARIPKTWTWAGPSRQRKRPRKGRLNDSGESSQLNDSSQTTIAARADDAIDGNNGRFVDEDGKTVPNHLKFKVVDLEMIPAQERGMKLALQIEGSFLDEQAEQELRDQERQKWEERQISNKPRSRQGTPMMSGSLAGSRAGSVASST